MPSRPAICLGRCGFFEGSPTIVPSQVHCMRISQRAFDPDEFFRKNKVKKVKKNRCGRKTSTPAPVELQFRVVWLWPWKRYYHGAPESRLTSLTLASCFSLVIFLFHIFFFYFLRLKSAPLLLVLCKYYCFHFEKANNRSSNRKGFVLVCSGFTRVIEFQSGYPAAGNRAVHSGQG